MIDGILNSNNSMEVENTLEITTHFLTIYAHQIIHEQFRFMMTIVDLYLYAHAKNRTFIAARHCAQSIRFTSASCELNWLMSMSMSMCSEL